MSTFAERARAVAEDLRTRAEEAADKFEQRLPDSVKEKLDVARDKAGEVLDKLDDKVPASVKERVGAVTDKLKDLVPVPKAPSSTSASTATSDGEQTPEHTAVWATDDVVDT